MEKNSTDNVLEICTREIGECTPQDSFEKLGLDSLEVLSLQQAIETECGVKIQDSEFSKVQTIADIIAIVDRLHVTA